MRIAARSKTLRYMASSLTVAGLAMGMGAATVGSATAAPTNRLCANGTYQAYIDYGNGKVSPIAVPNTPYECVTIKLKAGKQVSVYMRYDSGARRLLGTTKRVGDIYTTGYKNQPKWFQKRSS